MDIQHTLLTSLRSLARQHTEETLGDRREYLGASDIGYCPRKVILEKIHPSEYDLPTLLRFQRGHMAEDIIAMVFTAAGFTNFERQVEVAILGEVPVKVHIDFVFTSTVHKIKSILEIKSTSTIPDGPYSSWESQLYVQMGAIAAQYPDYRVRGAILALDLADGEVGFFNGYIPQNTIFRGLLDRAGSIWSDYQAILQGEQRELRMEVSQLCGFCSHLETCPKFAAEEVPQLAGSVQALQELQAREKDAQEQIKSLKRQLLAVVERKGPIISGGCYLKKAIRTRKYLDADRLGAFLAETGVHLDEYQEDRSFTYLEIRKKSAAAA